MEALLAIIKIFATLEPTIAQILPLVEQIVAGEKVTSAQLANLWTAIAMLEAKAQSQAQQITSNLASLAGPTS